VFCMSINGQQDIYTAKADGSDLTQVTDRPDFENGPDGGGTLLRHEMPN
jgi:hypothetical protein